MRTRADPHLLVGKPLQCWRRAQRLPGFIRPVYAVVVAGEKLGRKGNTETRAASRRWAHLRPGSRGMRRVDIEAKLDIGRRGRRRDIRLATGDLDHAAHAPVSRTAPLRAVEDVLAGGLNVMSTSTMRPGASGTAGWPARPMAKPCSTSSAVRRKRTGWPARIVTLLASNDTDSATRARSSTRRGKGTARRAIPAMSATRDKPRSVTIAACRSWGDSFMDAAGQSGLKACWTGHTLSRSGQRRRGSRPGFCLSGSAEWHPG